MTEFIFGEKRFFMSGKLGKFCGVFEWRKSRMGGEMKQIAGTLDFVTRSKTMSGARAALRKWLMKNNKLSQERARSYLKKEGYDPDCVDEFLLGRYVDDFCLDDGKFDYAGLLDAYDYFYTCKNRVDASNYLNGGGYNVDYVDMYVERQMRHDNISFSGYMDDQINFDELVDCYERWRTYMTRDDELCRAEFIKELLVREGVDGGYADEFILTLDDLESTPVRNDGTLDIDQILEKYEKWPNPGIRMG